MKGNINHKRNVCMEKVLRSVSEDVICSTFWTCLHLQFTSEVCLNQPHCPVISKLHLFYLHKKINAQHLQITSLFHDNSIWFFSQKSKVFACFLEWGVSFKNPGLPRRNLKSLFEEIKKTYLFRWMREGAPAWKKKRKRAAAAEHFKADTPLQIAMCIRLHLKIQTVEQKMP